MSAAVELRARRGSWIDTAVVALVAALVAAPGIGAPARLVFDELYYVTDAVRFLDQGFTTGFQAHPPLGTWLIALGVAAVDGPVGWRLTVLVLGLATVAVVHRLATRLLPATTGGRLLAAAAALLLVADGSWLVLTRTGMLDGPLTTLVVGAVAAGVVAGTTASAARRRGWLVATGVLVGLATGIKWSGAFAGLAVCAVWVLLDEHDRPGDRVRSVARRGGVAAAVAVVVYVLTWTPFAVSRPDVDVTGCPDAAAPCVASGGWRGVVEQHRSLLQYHTTFEVTGFGETAPGGWPLMQNSYGFFRPGCNVVADPELGRDGQVPECEAELVPGEDTIRFLGNPVVWIGFLALAPFAAVGARRGDRLAAVALIGWATQWLPWLAATRTSYIWYMAPTIPFAALAIVAGARRIPMGDVVWPVVTASVGAVAGGLLGTLTPVGVLGGAVIGWLLAPVVLGGGGGTSDTRPRAPAGVVVRRSQLVAVAVCLVAAIGVAALMRDQWVVSPDSPVDRVEPSTAPAG